MSGEAPRRFALRGRILHAVGDPAERGEAAIEDIPDGLLRIAEGRIAALGDYGDLRHALEPGEPLIDLTGRILLPGLIDAHVHCPQTGVVAAHGRDLLDWLERHTFPAESAFADPEHAREAARFFLDELLRNGTTAAVVYCTVHPVSVDALCEEASARGMRIVAGKVMMDRGAPAALRDTAETGYRESAALIARWHGRGRIAYAVTPRFAVTSSEAQLEAAGALLREHPGVYLQTHLAEQRNEIATVLRLFPWAASYTEVYDRFGLLGPRSLLGHCIHLAEAELARLSASRSVAVLCPTSNTFLGSGLVDLHALRQPPRPVRLGLATDIGGGTSYSMFQTMAELYKVARLRGGSIDPRELFHLATLGNARALGLEREIGSLRPGCAADLVVVDPARRPALARRLAAGAEEGVSDLLLALAVLGDEQVVEATFVAGRPLYACPGSGVSVGQPPGR